MSAQATSSELAANTLPVITWRLFTLRPAMQGVRYFAIAAVAFATVAITRAIGGTTYSGLAGYAPFALMGVLPVLYFETFGMQNAARFSVSAARALSVLPARHCDLRVAAWLLDVALEPLAIYFLAVAVVLPLPLTVAYKQWFVLALLLAVAIVLLLRAGTLLGNFKALEPSKVLRAAPLLERIDTLLLTMAFLAFPALFISGARSWATFLAAGLGVFSTGWSYFRLSVYFAAKPGGGGKARAARSQFTSGRKEVALIYLPTLVLASAFSLGFLGVELYFGRTQSAMLPIMFISMLPALGMSLAMRVRAIRLLPLSTGRLTLAVALQGLVAAVPLAPFIVYQYAGTFHGPWLVLLALDSILAMVALGAAGVWMLAYREAFIAVIMVVSVLFSFSMVGSIMMGVKEIPETVLATLAAPLCLAGVAVALLALRYRFFWNSRVYRPYYQSPQQVKATGLVDTFSDRGEQIMVGIVVLVGIAAIVAGIVALVGW